MESGVQVAPVCDHLTYLLVAQLIVMVLSGHLGLQRGILNDCIYITKYLKYRKLGSCNSFLGITYN